MSSYYSYTNSNYNDTIIVKNQEILQREITTGVYDLSKQITHVSKQVDSLQRNTNQQVNTLTKKVETLESKMDKIITLLETINGTASDMMEFIVDETN